MSAPRAFRDATHARARGQAAEDAAAAWLQTAGYHILERNHATKAGEIDLIAADADTLCFLEIKARATPTCGPAVAAVTPRKQRRLARAAALYLAAHPWPGPCRFDVLGLDPGELGWEYTLLKDAFQLA